jgi:hypothetical protein
MKEDIRWVTQYNDKGVLTSVPIDLGKYYAFEHILEDAEKEIEAKDIELACFRIRHHEANEHMNEQDKKIEELEKANKALLDQVAALKPMADRAEFADNRYHTLTMADWNRSLQIQDMVIQHKLQLDQVKALEAKSKKADAEIARLNQYNRDLLYKLEKAEANVVVKAGLHETAMEIIAKLETDLKMCKWQTRAVVSTLRETAGIVNEMYKRGDLKGVQDALTLMSKPDYLSEYCDD